MTDIQVKLTEFSDLITRYTADFVGREWLVDQVSALLDDPECRFVVLTGGAGVGKTAFLAHLAAAHPQWPRYFIRRDSRDLLRPGDANTFLLTIGGQLATLYPHLFHPENVQIVVRQRIGGVEAGGEATGARIEELRTSPFYEVALRVEQKIRKVAGKATALRIGRLVSEPRLLQMQDLQYLGLLDPARLLAQENPDARIVVLVDALDELRYSPAEPDMLRVLRELPEVPSNLRFVISSRPEMFLERLLARHDARELPLDVAGADNWADLRTYAECTVGGDEWKPVLEQEGLSPEAFVDGLLGKAAGNFLYLKSVLSGIQQALEDPGKRDRLSHLLRVEELPGELGGLYGHFLAFIVKWAKDEFGAAAWREYLRPFLGILAVAQEPLGEEQIIAFTDLKRESIRDLQRELRQFVETVSGEYLVYRIYHSSFAEYLLNGEQNRDYWIDGQERHRRIANRYLNAWGGLEASLPGVRDAAKRDLDGGYGLRHLAAHLEGANRWDDLHYLLRLERRVGEQLENLWYVVKEMADESESYIADAARAWRLAEEAASPTSQFRIGLQIRYALVASSFSSLGQNLPPVLLKMLVQEGIWTSVRGLTYARLVLDPWRKVKAFTALIPHLPARLRDQALDDLLTAIQEITNDESRAWALVGLIPHLMTPLREQAVEDGLGAAIAAVRQPRSALEIRDDSRADVLVALAPYLSEEELKKALGALREIEDVWERDEALVSLAPHLPDGLFRELLVTLYELWDQIIEYGPGPRKDEVLFQLALHAPATMVEEILEATEEIRNTFRRARVIAALAPHLPEESLQEAFAVVRRSPKESPIGTEKAELMTRLAIHMPEKSRVLALEETVAAVNEIEDDEIRLKALIGLTPYIPSPLRDQLIDQALAAVPKLSEWGGLGLSRAVEVLVSLASELPEALLKEALAAIRKSSGELFGPKEVGALCKLAPHLSERLLREALLIAREIANPRLRSEALSNLAVFLPTKSKHQVLHEAWVAVRQIGDEEELRETLNALALYLPTPPKESMPEKLLKKDYKIADDEQPTSWYAISVDGKTTLLGPHRPEALAIRDGILERAYKALDIADEGVRKRMLRESLSEVRRLSKETKTFIAEGGIENLEMGTTASEVLAALSPRLPENLFGEALAVIRELPEHGRFGSPKSDALIALAACLPGHMLGDVLMIAREIGSEWSRHRALNGLVTRLTSLSRLKLAQFWFEKRDGFSLLHLLARRTRKDLLSDLRAFAPVIVALGGEKAAEETFGAIQDVGRWWP
jgi:hypothetical protein